jgi:hypothetical protein
MSSLKGDFMDAQNIVIFNDVPHFSFKGNSYLERLKNGLSLDFVFFMEDSAVKPEEDIENNSEEDYKQQQPLKHEHFVEEYDCDTFPRPRKGKKTVKKRSNKMMKKNKVRQNGYNDKMFKIDNYLSSVYDEKADEKYYYFDEYKFLRNICKKYCVSCDWDMIKDEYNIDVSIFKSKIYNLNNCDLKNFVCEYCYNCFKSDELEHYNDELFKWHNSNHTGRGWD